jgi:serine/threonine-protein kinase HipA
MDVVLHDSAMPLGKLVFVKDGHKAFSHFAYHNDWLTSPQFFQVSPDLKRQSGYQLHKPATPTDSYFFLALADTEPDSWGRRVIARAHAKARANNPTLAPLTEVDYLSNVDDFSRIGALRLLDENGNFLRSNSAGKNTTPILLDLEKILTASRAVESNVETAADLAYLQGKATSLGGLRPKCTLLDHHGALAIGKFPSVNDDRAITRGEVLAMRLARLAGIDSAAARIEMVNEQPIAIVQRFDRHGDRMRIPYISATTLLQANREGEHSYLELLDVMRNACENFRKDAQQLWRRLVFNLLINNVDDHLHNIGFLYCRNDLWRLAPAFDLNPFPDKISESKTWLSEATGPISSMRQLMHHASRFELSPSQAQSVGAEVIAAVKSWKDLAGSKEVGLSKHELNDFKPAFERDVA